MPFILILIGLVLVYIGLKIDKKNDDKGYNGQFNTILDNKFIEEDINNINEIIKDLKYRTENLEQSVILIHDKLNNKDNSSEVVEFDDAKDTNLDIVTIEEKYDVNAKVYSLSDQGKTVDEIASLLKIGKGEILLRLGLKNQKNSF